MYPSFVRVSFLYFGYVFAGCSKNRIFSRGKARCTGESRSRGRDLLIRVSRYVGFSTGWVHFFLFSFFSLCLNPVLLFFLAFVGNKRLENFRSGRRAVSSREIFANFSRGRREGGFELLSKYLSKYNWAFSCSDSKP